MKYRIEIWQHHSVTDSYESDYAQECWKWIRHNGYDFMDEEWLCYIAYYKDGEKLSIPEAVDLAGEWDEQFQKAQDTERDEKPNKQTNFEWLKSLSAEKLARWFYKEVCLMKCPAQIPAEWKESKCGDCPGNPHIPDCDAQCTLKWLLEEHKE